MTTNSTDDGPHATGADENCAFIVVEVALEHALTEQKIPTYIPRYHILPLITKHNESHINLHAIGETRTIAPSNGLLYVNIQEQGWTAKNLVLFELFT